jgi:chromosome partitioning protein
VLTVLNLKGDVGKTHTAWLAASVCQERGQRILLIDTDAQGNLTSSFVAIAGDQPAVEALLNPAADCDAATLIRRTSFPCIDLIPASRSLVRFDLSNQKQWEQGDLRLSFIDAMDALRPKYDMIVFDCPPRLSLVSFAALCASDCVVIPMEAADWGAQGIVQVTEAIRYVQRRHNSSLRLLGYLVSRFKRRRTYQQSYLNQLRTHFGDLAFDTVIPDLAQFEKSVTDRIPVTVHAPRSESADIARRFFDELQARIEGQPRIGVGGSPTSLHHTAAVVA